MRFQMLKSRIRPGTAETVMLPTYGLFVTMLNSMPVQTGTTQSYKLGHDSFTLHLIALYDRQRGGLLQKHVSRCHGNRTDEEFSEIFFKKIHVMQEKDCSLKSISHVLHIL